MVRPVPLSRAAAGFRQSFTRSQEGDRTRPGVEHDPAKFWIGHIATSQPHELRWRPMLSEQLREVIVLRHDDRASRCCARCRETFGVAGTMQAEFLDVHRNAP
jgi:hypothetical protein